MRTSSAIISLLDKLFVSETTAIAQYQAHRFIAKNNGYDILADYFKEKSEDEYHHWKKLATRILFLEGVPSFGKTDPFEMSIDLEAQLSDDLAFENTVVANLNAAIHELICGENIDMDTADLLQDILEDEIEHIDELEKTIRQIAAEGLDNFLSTMREKND